MLDHPYNCSVCPQQIAYVLQVARVIGTKSADECQALYSRFKSYLSLPKGIQHQVAFLAMVKDMVESESKVGPCRAHRSAASGSQGLLKLSCKVPPVRRLA